MMNTQNVFVAMIWISMFLIGAESLLYLPGVPPKVYDEGDAIPVIANALDSVETLTPFDFYSLPFCEPEDGVMHKFENLGQTLAGDVEDNTLFDIHMGHEIECQLLCTTTLTSDQLALFAERIREDYYVNLDVDNLPAAKKLVVFTNDKEMHDVIEDLSNPELSTQGEDSEDVLEEQEYYLERGFPLGIVDEDTDNVMLHNHWQFIISYNDEGHIVEFEMMEQSVNHEMSEEGKASGCTGRGGMVIEGPSGFDKVNSMDVSWTYSVSFVHSDTQWRHRWEPYLKIRNVRFHLMQLSMSILIVGCLGVAAGWLIMRALKRDIALFRSQNAVAAMGSPTADSEPLTDSDGSWKSLSGDIFRRPKYPMLLAIIIGSGQQTMLMVLSSIFISAVGLASPAMHRSLINFCVFLFAVLGAVNGYESTRWYRYFQGQDSIKKHVLKTALYFPAFNFAVFLFVDLVIWADSGAEATNAVPFGTFVVLIAIWSLISAPMVYIGAYYGNKAAPITVPCRTRRIKRVVPSKPWYLQKETMMLTTGMIVFASGYIEMSIILSAVWGHRMYFAFGFLLVTVLLMMFCSALLSILVVYVRLLCGDYNWWWISFFAPASSGAFMFLYSIHFLSTQLHVMVTWTSYAVYFGYMFLLSTAVAMMTGCVGFTAAFMMLRTIYRAIKSD